MGTVHTVRFIMFLVNSDRNSILNRPGRASALSCLTLTCLVSWTAGMRPHFMKAGAQMFLRINYISKLTVEIQFEVKRSGACNGTNGKLGILWAEPGGEGTCNVMLQFIPLAYGAIRGCLVPVSYGFRIVHSAISCTLNEKLRSRLKSTSKEERIPD